MDIPFRQLLGKVCECLLRGSRKTGRTALRSRQLDYIDPDAIARAAMIVAPFVEDAYRRSNRSTAAGLAKALEVLKSLEDSSSAPSIKGDDIPMPKRGEIQSHQISPSTTETIPPDGR